MAFKKILLVMVGGCVLLLAGCAKHPLYYGCNHSENCDALSMIHPPKFMSGDKGLVYTPPRVNRTWINTHVTSNNQVAGAHYRYWVSNPGHWNVPISTEAGVGHDLLGPDGD